MKKLIISQLDLSLVFSEFLECPTIEIPYSWSVIMDCVDKIEKCCLTSSDMKIDLGSEMPIFYFRVFLNNYHGECVGFGKSENKQDAYIIGILEFISMATLIDVPKFAEP